jgi:hypothetical protein
MADLSGLTTNFFPTPKEGFTTTISGTVDSSTDTEVPLNSVSGLTNGNVFTGIIDPGNAKERAFTGVVDTGGSQITNVVFTTGSNATHTAGATVVDYVTSTHIAQIVKGLLTAIFDQDGTMKAGAVDNAAALASNVVTTAKILDANVTTAKIADAAVTPVKRTGGFAAGLIAASTFTTTGNKSVTGLGFTPKLVEFVVISTTSTTAHFQGQGAMTTSYQFTTCTGGNTTNTVRYGSTSNCIASFSSLADSTPEVIASYVSMDADGFTINVGTAGTGNDIAYKAYA